MCQILFSESANPPRQAIVDGNEMNQDGFGYAYRESGKVHYSKGYTKEQMDTEFIDAYLTLPFPKAIHFRLATHGGTLPQLTHPFPIKRGNPHDLAGTSKSVLFHNGIWHMYDDRLREAILGGALNPNVLKGGLSDSRAMAILAQRFGDDILRILNLAGNKVLVLKDDTFYRFGSWTEKEGWSASNSKIFRVEPVPVATPPAKRMEEKGVKLDASGLPLRGVEIVGVAKGHLNRHGNVRSKFRRGSVYTGERDLGPTSREVDASRELAGRLKEQDDAIASVQESFRREREHNKRDLPTGGYLSATAAELAEQTNIWSQFGGN